ncbi:MAG: DUF4476 domain-containing protein [Chitinophagaceae bacterium]|nr:DUF4476 domain-containing protein [Chitinophagaceae bacterium]
MKKIITLLLIICTTTASFAYYEPARLTISSFGNSSLRIMIDGNKYNSNNTDFSLNNLSNGNHTIKIYQQNSKWNKNTKWNKKGNYKLVYNGNIMVKSTYHIDIVINRFGKAFIDERMIGNENNQDNEWNGSSNNWNFMPETITSESLEQLKSAIKSEFRDADKLSVAKLAINNNYFSTLQVKELIGLFWQDDIKLELAKYMYKFTTDKNNYYTLKDLFGFNSNKEEFIKYLETVQK